MRLVPTAYLVSHMLSMVGSSVVGVLLQVMILQTTGSGVDAGLVALATTVPAVAAGLLLGAVTDRVNRCGCCVVADLVSATAVSALALVSVTSGPSPCCAGSSGSGRSQGQIRVLPGGGSVAALPDLGS